MNMNNEYSPGYILIHEYLKFSGKTNIQCKTYRECNKKILKVNSYIVDRIRL